MGLIKAVVVLIVAIGIADFIKKKQEDYIANRCNIILAIVVMILILL